MLNFPPAKFLKKCPVCQQSLKEIIGDETEYMTCGSDEYHEKTNHFSIGRVFGNWLEEFVITGKYSIIFMEDKVIIKKLHDTEDYHIVYIEAPGVKISYKDLDSEVKIETFIQDYQTLIFFEDILEYAFYKKGEFIDHGSTIKLPNSQLRYSDLDSEDKIIEFIKNYNILC